MTSDPRTNYVSLGADTETCDGDANSFQLTWNGIPYVFITRPEWITAQFLAVLDSLPKTRGTVYVLWFHNIAFDVPVIFPAHHNQLRDEEFEFEFNGWTISGVYAHVCFITLRKGDKHIEMLGTDSYFKTSLAKLGDAFCPDLPKLTPPKDIGQKFYDATDEEFIAYAARDAVICEIVGNSIVEMHARYNIQLSVSAPHMASRIFRRKFLTATIPLPSMSIVYSALHSYHGGKNNFPVKPGLYKNVQCVDIKSAYPFAMASFPSFSQRDLYLRFHPSPGFTSVPSFGIYKISGNAKLTPWPVIFDHAFKPVYGEFKGIWITGFELNQALKCGLVKVESCEGYFYDAQRDKVISPFAAYVAHFYSQKEKKGIPKSERDFYKILMNSLYGKLIETRGASSLLNVRYDVDTSTHEMSLELVTGTLFNPFIATLITGHTRAYIHSLEMEFQAIHTSTDGIMTQSKVPARDLGNELGEINIEATGDVLLLRNKLYIVYTKDKGKAARDRNGKPIASILEKGSYVQKYALHGFFGDVRLLETLVKTGTREYEYTKVNKLRESLRRNLKVNRFEKQQRTLNLPTG